jgi:hypothetical protein
MFENAHFFRICISSLQKILDDPDNFFRDKYQNGYQKTLNFMLIINSLMPTYTNASQKAIAKKLCEF